MLHGNLPAVYFYSARVRRSRGASWSSFSPPLTRKGLKGTEGAAHLKNRDTTPQKFGAVAFRCKGSANIPGAGVYCTNLSRLAEEPGKEEDGRSNDPIASFGDLWKCKSGRSSDNRALRNRAARLTSKSDVHRYCARRI